MSHVPWHASSANGVLLPDPLTSPHYRSLPSSPRAARQAPPTFPIALRRRPTAPVDPPEMHRSPRSLSPRSCSHHWTTDQRTNNNVPPATIDRHREHPRMRPSVLQHPLDPLSYCNIPSIRFPIAASPRSAFGARAPQAAAPTSWVPSGRARGTNRVATARSSPQNRACSHRRSCQRTGGQMSPRRSGVVSAACGVAAQ